MAVTVTLDTIQQALLELGLSDMLNPLTLYQALERRAPKTDVQTTQSPPPLDPQQSTGMLSGEYLKRYTCANAQLYYS